MSATKPASIPLSDLLDSLPEGIIWMEAIRDTVGQVTDFQLRYINAKASALSISASPLIVGTRLLADHAPYQSFTELIFSEMCQILAGGDPTESELLSHTTNRWFSLRRSKLGDGVMSVFRDITARKQARMRAADERAIYNGVLNASINGIITYKAVRDAAGTIINFQALIVNPLAASVLQLADTEPGWYLLERFPSVLEQGTFAQYVQVVNTGQSVRFETFYAADGLNGWYDVSAVKLGDGFVITFNDITANKIASTKIDTQNQLLAGILNTSLNGTVVYKTIRNQEGQIVDFAFRLFNQTARDDIRNRIGKDIANSTLLTVYPDSHETGLFALYARVTETGQPMRLDHYYPDVNTWYDVSLTKFEDGCVVTFINITHTKLAQQNLEEQAALLSSVLDSSINGIIAFTSVRDTQNQIVDFTFLSVNEAACQLVNKTAEELIDKTLLDVFPNDSRNGVFANYVQTAETGEPTRVETYYNHNGLDFWLDLSARKLGDGFVVTFTDISVVKRATHAVEASAQELQTVIDTAQTGIFLFAPIRNEQGVVIDFRFRTANRMLADYVGQEPATVTGALGSDWFPGYKSNGLFEAYHYTYATGKSNRFDFHYNTDGIDAWLDIMATKMGDEVLVTFSDYTPLKKLQLQTEALVEDLRKSNANLEQFAYVASHDLQEPLRKIVSFGDVLHEQYGPSLGKEGQDYIARMQGAAGRMQTLIKDLLAYSRVASNKVPFAPLSLKRLITEVLGDLETVIQEKKAIVQIGPFPTLKADAMQLRQLFQNLLSNALKFTHKNTQPIISLTSQVVKGSTVSQFITVSDAHKWFYQIEIQDNGIGFDPKYAERIFQVFQRLHGRSDYQGTGIGLAIVQKVVDNHKGYIRAEGRPGEGAMFTILLPATD